MRCATRLPYWVSPASLQAPPGSASALADHPSDTGPRDDALTSAA